MENPPKPLTRATLQTGLALWGPMLVLIALSEHDTWFLRRLHLLPGILPATALGAKTSDRGLALACTLSIVVALTLVARPYPKVGWAVSLATGTVLAVWLHAVSRM